MFHKSILLIFIINCYFFVKCEKLKLFEELFEGANCTTEDGYNGTCVHINRCRNGARLLKMGQHPKTCSFQGKMPVICCSDCELVDDLSDIIFDKDGILYHRTGQKASDKCLEYMIELPYPCELTEGLERFWNLDEQCHTYGDPGRYDSIGGENAVRDEYPHMALLGYGPDLESAQWLCGGSVISEKYILTAAHCISSPEGPVAFVALGILKRTDPPEMWQRYTVGKIIPHPQYQSPSKYHDIALLETVERIKFNQSVLPACLNLDDKRGILAMATGWGALGNRKELADNLQTVTLTRFGKEECAQQYPEHRLLLDGYDHKSQMCYGDQNTVRDTCEGDSGGPLQINSFSTICMNLILGVTSYGRSCGVVGNAGMYTRVSYYLPWIESIVWP